jgi:hypothetical protein
MRRFTPILILLVSLVLLPAASATAGFFTDDTLVSIDGKNYTVDDFKRWWGFWNDDNSPLPKTPDPYIDWLLLSREGQRMDLDSSPGFKRQTRIFLQSRGLMMLKYDAVDSRIKVTDDAVKARYEEQYLPRWQVQRLIFKDDKAALAAWQEIKDGKVPVEEILARNAEKGGPASTNDVWLRPKGIDPGWADIFRKMKVGEVVDPSKHKNGAVLYYLKDQKGSDEEDFAKLREDIRKDLWREQENDLTKELLDGLKAKYHVKVNEERVEALNINAADDTYTDEPVITSDRQNVSEKQFMSVIRRLMNTREQAAHAASDEKAARDLKASTVDNIIAQSVTNWESLDRHFEEKEPFKWEYEFNYHHRLVQALEQRLFVPEAKVTDDEIKQYYQENIKRYTQPTLVKLYLIDETQGPIDQIWAEAATGVAFDKVAEKKGIKLKALETPVNHLDPEVKPMVEKMVDGETSPIFTAQGVKVIAHLLERTPETPLPLDRVKSSIRSHLSSEKIRQSRSAYLDKIKSQSKIEIKQRQWKAIQKELGGKK